MGGNYIADDSGEVRLTVAVYDLRPGQNVQIDVDTDRGTVETVLGAGKER